MTAIEGSEDDVPVGIGGWMLLPLAHLCFLAVGGTLIVVSGRVPHWAAIGISIVVAYCCISLLLVTLRMRLSVYFMIALYAIGLLLSTFELASPYMINIRQYAIVIAVAALEAAALIYLLRSRRVWLTLKN